MKKSYDIKDACAAALLVLCSCMTAFYLIVGYGAYLDSDMASELVLASHLASEQALFSTTWYYSTEVRLLNTQLVFTPLMVLFSENWQLVRTLGCMILLIILAGACLYAASGIGAKRRYAYVFAGLIISMISPLYAQNVIIGAYYVPHAVLSFVMVGLYARWLRNRKRSLVVVLLVLALVMGVSTVRYLLSAIAPLACAALWEFTFPAEEELQKRTRKQWQALLLGMGVAAAGVIGYVIGGKALPLVFKCNPGYYGSVGYADFSQHDLASQIQMVIFGLLSSMGFEDNVPLFGVQGILNALVLLELFVGGMLLVRAFRREQDGITRMGVSTFAFSFGLSMCAFILLRSLYFDRYWLPVLMLGAPVMAACLSYEKNGILRRLSLLLFAGTVLLTSLSCVYYSMRNPQIKSEARMAVVDAAQVYGVTRGYATFWNANIVTEISDGNLDVVSVKLVRDEAGDCKLHPHRWLEEESDFIMEQADEPVFLLIGSWESQGTEKMLERMGAQHIEIEGWIDFYIVPSQRALFEEIVWEEEL